MISFFNHSCDECLYAITVNLMRLIIKIVMRNGHHSHFSKYTDFVCMYAIARFFFFFKFVCVLCVRRGCVFVYVAKNEG